MITEPIFLKPIFKDYIWGGKRLKELFNKEVENRECTAESWEISANKSGKTIISNGQFKGKNLEELFNQKELKKEIFGENCMNLAEFPLLIKFIDANKNLSVQVHPNNEYAIKNENSLGKCEMWYILECGENAQIICGVKPETKKEELEENTNTDKITDYLNFVNIKKGDTIYIKSGTIHALLGDIVVAEVQQNSDITYRLYDWGRIGKDGKPRELHIKKALDVIDIECEPNIVNVNNIEGRINIVNCEFFQVNKINNKNNIIIETSEKSFIAINVIEGKGILKLNNKQYKINKGDSFIIPACNKSYELIGNIECLESYIN